MIEFFIEGRCVNTTISVSMIGVSMDDVNDLLNQKPVMESDEVRVFGNDWLTYANVVFPHILRLLGKLPRLQRLIVLHTENVDLCMLYAPHLTHLHISNCSNVLHLPLWESLPRLKHCEIKFSNMSTFAWTQWKMWIQTNDFKHASIEFAVNHHGYKKHELVSGHTQKFFKVALMYHYPDYSDRLEHENYHEDGLYLSYENFMDSPQKAITDTFRVSERLETIQISGELFQEDLVNQLHEATQWTRALRNIIFCRESVLTPCTLRSIRRLILNRCHIQEVFFLEYMQYRDPCHERELQLLERVLHRKRQPETLLLLALCRATCSASRLIPSEILHRVRLYLCS